MPKALELADAICANARIAVQESKRCIRKGMRTDIYTGSAFEAEAFGVTCGAADKDEGMGAFLEKRKEKNFENMLWAAGIGCLPIHRAAHSPAV